MNTSINEATRQLFEATRPSPKKEATAVTLRDLSMFCDAQRLAYNSQDLQQVLKYLKGSQTSRDYDAMSPTAQVIADKFSRMVKSEGSGDEAERATQVLLEVLGDDTEAMLESIGMILVAGLGLDTGFDMKVKIKVLDTARDYRDEHPGPSIRPRH